MAEVKTYTLDGTTHYYIDYDERFCGSCDEYFGTIIDVDAWVVDGDGEPCEPDYDDTIGEPRCAVCDSEDLYESEEECAERARENYEIDRADAIRKGEW